MPMFRIIFIILITLINNFAWCQKNNEDLIKKLEKFKFRDWDSISYYAHKILEGTEVITPRIKGMAYQNLGVVQFEKFSNYDSALALYDLALEQLTKDPDSVLLATLYNSYGVVMKYRADYENSLNYFFRALDYLPADSLLKLNITILNNIGEVNYNLGEPLQAEDYHRQAFQMAIELSDTFLLGNTLTYLGNIDIARGKFRNAIENYRRSMNYLKNYDTNRAGIIMNMGAVYHLQGDLERARYYYRNAVDEGEKYGDMSSIALGYLNLGEAMVDMKDPEAVTMLKRSIEISSGLNLTRYISIAHRLLSSYFENVNNFRTSLDHFKLHKIYNDSVINESTQNRLTELQVKYETAQREKKIADQQLQIEQKNASISRQKNQKILFVATLAFLIIIGGYHYFNYRIRQKARLQQAVISEKERGIEAVFKATENERQRISRDLHDGIGQQLSGLKLKLESLETGIKDESIKRKTLNLREELIHASNDIRKLSHQIMPRSLKESGLIPSLTDLLDKTFTDTGIKCSFEHLVSDQRFSETVEISLYRVVQELVNNIIKHAGARKITVQLYQVKKRLVLTVTDDGKGFNHTNTNSGHGLLNIKNRINNIKGSVNIESEAGTGTVATISIPIN